MELCLYMPLGINVDNFTFTFVNTGNIYKWIHLCNYSIHTFVCMFLSSHILQSYKISHECWQHTQLQKLKLQIVNTKKKQCNPWRLHFSFHITDSKHTQMHTKYNQSRSSFEFHISFQMQTYIYIRLWGLIIVKQIQATFSSMHKG